MSLIDVCVSEPPTCSLQAALELLCRLKIGTFMSCTCYSGGTRVFQYSCFLRTSSNDVFTYERKSVVTITIQFSYERCATLFARASCAKILFAKHSLAHPRGSSHTDLHDKTQKNIKHCMIYWHGVLVHSHVPVVTGAYRLRCIRVLAHMSVLAGGIVSDS